MADNVAITSGTGTTIAADDVGGALHQRVKATWGPDGTGNDVDVATGKPMPVQLRGSDGTDRSNLLPISAASLPLPTGAATLAKQPALGTAGTASADVITIQGIASGTVVPVSATLKTTFGTATAFTKTNANLTNSLTAGWKSNAIDNTTTRAIDALIGIELAAVNTAPSAPSTLYVFAYGLIEGTAYASTGDGTIDGTEGTVTFPSVTTLPVVLKQIGTISYPVQNRAINQLFRWCGGQNDLAVLPDKWGIAIVNATGMTISVTNIFYQEIFSALV